MTSPTHHLRTCCTLIILLALAAAAPATVAAGPVYLLQWGSQGGGAGQFQTPYGAATGPGGEIYVADYGNQRIQFFNGTGGYLGQWGSPGSGEGEFNSPAGVATDAAGNVYVADLLNHRIRSSAPPARSSRSGASPEPVTASSTGRMRWR
jgi:DNA-binding beta-propeller fold protein YncE